MALFGNGVEKAENELRQLQEARSKLEGRAISAEAELHGLESGATERALAEYLDSGEDASLQARVARAKAQTLREELASLPTVRRELAQRIRAAILTVAKARAEVIWRDVVKKEKALAAYAAERSKLLQALETLTGAHWLVELGSDALTAAVSGGEIRLPPPIDRGVVMAEEIDALRRQADRIEAEGASHIEGGAVGADTLPELLRAIEGYPLAPTAAAVEA